MRSLPGFQDVSTFGGVTSASKYDVMRDSDIVQTGMACADPEGGGGGRVSAPLPPEKSQKYRVS